MINSLKNILIVLLVVSTAFFSIQLNKEKNKTNDLLLEKELIEKELKNIIQFKDNEVKVVYRYKDKIVTEIKYLPPEGKLKITIDKNDNQDVNITNKGWTFGPNVGVSYSNKMSFMLGARVFYWNRYGGGLGLNNNGLSLYIDRRIDDVFKFLPNTSMGIFLGEKELGLKLSAFL